MAEGAVRARLPPQRARRRFRRGVARGARVVVGAVRDDCGRERGAEEQADRPQPARDRARDHGQRVVLREDGPRADREGQRAGGGCADARSAAAARRPAGAHHGGRPALRRRARGRHARSPVGADELPRAHQGHLQELGRRCLDLEHHGAPGASEARRHAGNPLAGVRERQVDPCPREGDLSRARLLAARALLVQLQPGDLSAEPRRFSGAVVRLHESR